MTFLYSSGFFFERKDRKMLVVLMESSDLFSRDLLGCSILKFMEIFTLEDMQKRKGNISVVLKGLLNIGG